MLPKEVFDGFSVPLRSAISAHRRNLSKEDKNTSRETIPVMGVFMRGKNMAESNTYNVYSHDRKRKFSLGVLTRSSYMWPKAIEL